MDNNNEDLEKKSKFWLVNLIIFISITCMIVLWGLWLFSKTKNPNQELYDNAISEEVIGIVFIESTFE